MKLKTEILFMRMNKQKINTREKKKKKKVVSLKGKFLTQYENM